MQLRVTHRNLKWTRAAFDSFLKMTETNAWAMARTNANNLGQKEFLMAIANYLLFSIPPKSFTLPVGNNPHRLISTELKRDCWVCQQEKKHSTTTLYCLGCHLYMHNNCHDTLHNLATTNQRLVYLTLLPR